MAAFKNNKFGNKISKTLKNRFFALSKLTWLTNKKTLDSMTNRYEELPKADPHQEEMDENALNEALEARLMEVIANAPAQDAPITLQIGIQANASILPTNVDLTFYNVQTYCQSAEAQVY